MKEIHTSLDTHGHVDARCGVTFAHNIASGPRDTQESARSARHSCEGGEGTPSLSRVCTHEPLYLRESLPSKALLPDPTVLQALPPAVTLVMANASIDAQLCGSAAVSSSASSLSTAVCAAAAATAPTPVVVPGVHLGRHVDVQRW